MERLIINALIRWKESEKRKPLVLKGARQVGKTYILEKFGEKQFSKCHYIDLRENKKIHSIFSENNPNEIIRQLEFALRIEIDTKNDILILDEIQDCKGAITSFKYFEKDLPELALIGAGSHLGMTKNEESFPVGKVNFLYMFPMNFEEFIKAVDVQAYDEYEKYQIHDPKPIPEIIHIRLLELLKYYHITGGLPEVVQRFIDSSDEKTGINEARERQKELIEGYKADFAKYSSTVNANHIHNVFESIPAQLSKAHDETVSKYIFKNVIPNQKGYDRIIGPLGWLIKSRLCIKSLIASKAENPLRAYCSENKFKIYLFDIGILNCMINNPPEAILSEKLGSYKGFIAENFIAQELYSYLNEDLISWTEGRSEIEFLINDAENIYPIEVKASKRSRLSKSLDAYIDRYHPNYAFKLSGQNVGIQKEKNMFILPIYLCGKILKNIKTRT